MDANRLEKTERPDARPSSRRPPDGSKQLEIPDGVSDLDRQRIKQVNRNIRIRRDYPGLRDEHGQHRAYQELASREGCSVSTVRKVLNGRR